MTCTGCPPISQLIPSLGSGPIGVAPCSMYDRQCAGDRRLVGARERAFTGREDADLDRLARSLVGRGPAGVCRSACVGRSGRLRRRCRRLSATVAPAAAPRGDRGQRKCQDGQDHPEAPWLACFPCIHAITPFTFHRTRSTPRGRESRASRYDASASPWLEIARSSPTPFATVLTAIRRQAWRDRSPDAPPDDVADRRADTHEASRRQQHDQEEETGDDGVEPLVRPDEVELRPAVVLDQREDDRAEPGTLDAGRGRRRRR